MSIQLEHGVREFDSCDIIRCFWPQLNFGKPFHTPQTPHIIRQLVDKRRTGLRVDWIFFRRLVWKWRDERTTGLGEMVLSAVSCV